LKALLYREFVWFKRYFPDYLGMWAIQLGFSIGVVFMPAYISGGQAYVLSRLKTLYGVEFTAGGLIAFTLTLSSLIGVVALIVGDVFSTLYYEFRIAETNLTVMEASSLADFLFYNALGRSSLLCFFATLYLLALLPLMKGLEGLFLYLAVLALLLPASIALGLLSSILALATITLTPVRRPWAIANLIPPILLASVGLYIPVELVPFLLRLVAYITPLPFVVEALQALLLFVGQPIILGYLTTLLVVYTLYLTVPIVLLRRAERWVRG